MTYRLFIAIFIILSLTIVACQGGGVSPATSSLPGPTQPPTGSNAPQAPPPPTAVVAAKTTSAPTSAPRPVGGTPSAGTPIASGTAGPMVAVPGVPGRIVYAKDGGFWTLEPATGKLTLLATVPPRNYVGAPAISPDGKHIVYSLYDVRRATEKKDNGTDLYLMTADGKNQQLLIEHDIIGAWFSEPEWMPDGKTLLFTRRDTKGKESIERLTVQGAKRELVIDSATSPSLSPDGKQLVYLVTDPQSYTQDLWFANADGSNPKRLVGDPEFEALVNPRFAPNGQRIAFVGVGGPDQQPPRKAALQPGPTRPGLFQPPTAQAHGIPYNIWTIKPDGTDLRRLTNDLEVELPTITWSPDGQWLAFTSDQGLNVLSADGSQLHFLGRDFAVGGLDWFVE